MCLSSLDISTAREGSESVNCLNRTDCLVIVFQMCKTHRPKDYFANSMSALHLGLTSDQSSHFPVRYCVKACLHRRAVTGSGNGKRYAARYCPFIHKGGNTFGMQISMLMTFHKYQALGAAAPVRRHVCFTLQRPCQPVRDVIPNETADWPERAVSARYL